MATGVNVLRYSALGFGVIYGLLHQTSLTAASKSAHVQQEYKHKEELISKAKAEYVKRTSPQQSGGEDKSISDPSDPNFDLEKYLKSAAGEKI